jgi:hypothetical protein
MNNYIIPGSSVIITKDSVNNGYTSDSEKVKKLLKIGKIYTVKKVSIGKYFSCLYLKEMPNIPFNIVNFINIVLEKEGEKL